jgi:hypothetical protein
VKRKSKQWMWLVVTGGLIDYYLDVCVLVGVVVVFGWVVLF